MKLSEVIFLDSFPSIDLHGMDRDSARVMVNDFVSDNKKMGNEFIVIVHGIGTGIIRRETHDVLRKNKDVLEFKTDYFNNGLTIVRLNIE